MSFLRRLLSGQTDVAPGISSTAPPTNSPPHLPTLPPFQYTPLPSPTTHFRILQLQPTAADLATPWTSIPLRGTLLPCPISSPPAYHALSYCWGDATPADSIIVDGAILRITASCAAALRRMLRGKPRGRKIWVDAICINQADDAGALRERGAQVAMMDRIYRGAEQVDVYVGEGDAGTEVACEAVRRLVKYSVGAAVPGSTGRYFARKYEALAMEVLACTPEYPYGKLHGLFRQPWFGRYWVIQEVALAQNVTFYCGKHLLLLSSIIIATDFSPLSPTLLESNPMAVHWRTYTMYHTSVQAWIRQRENHSATPNVPPPALSQVIIPPALLFEATRPEDKVHALYGICKRLGYDLPVPDYTKSLAIVYTETAQAILRYDGQQGLDQLLESACASPSSRDQGIPSWAPDLSSCIRKWSSANLPNSCMNDRRNTWPSGRGNPGCQFELGTDSSKLRVKGRRLDIVCEPGTPWEIDNAATNIFGRDHAPTGSHIFALMTSLESWFAIVLRSMNAVSASQASTAGLRLAEVLAKDTKGNSSVDDLQELSRYLALAMTIAKRSEDPGRLVLADRTMDPQDYVRHGDNCTLSEAMYMQLGRIMPGMAWKTVFRTAQGFLGVGPYSVAEGDVTVVFQGCSLAGLLRPAGEGYSYVGPAYVLGVMHGEFWEAGEAGDDEWFELV
ncbi:heterokaryon incompatibility protein-domain-containing protein [Schizothecium vesticola]|uniref:Heterokaryon incompatibility protein-domain-containing protein n=1 Tax=Schizothecium vesticola TaxID=314040 RepID=A0AA40EJ76_9PEZI|nr:heterokaryon incompatibility protein-domain-containing protein [Schizothecium vesticola]